MKPSFYEIYFKLARGAGPWTFLLAFFLVATPTTLTWAQNTLTSRDPAQTRTNKNKDILINADSMERDSVSETIEAQGNVQIVYQGQHIKADQARVNLRSRRLELAGNVEVVTSKSTLGGDVIQLDYETNTGIIHNGYVQSGAINFEGRLLQKTGPEEYYVVEADYTACTNCPASWSFSGSSIRAELGGYAYIKSSFLRLGGVRVFWLPYLIVPLKSDRQSGLMPPGFENSDRGGATLEQPYFWAISRSTDATLTARYYTKLGPKILGQYRYVPNENSYGELNAAAIPDQAFSNENRVKPYRSPTDAGKPYNRWFLRYNHYYEMPDNFVHRAKINMASDLQYSRDFQLETLNYGDSAMENSMSLTKNTDYRHFSGEATYYRNMLHSNPLSGNEDAVHRLPELRFSQVSKNVGDTDWLYNFDIDYSNFTRAGPAYDDLVWRNTTPGQRFRSINNSCPGGGTAKPDDNIFDRDPNCYRLYDGRYDPDVDLIRTGQRFDFSPSIYRTFKPIEGMDLVPRLTYRETHYNFSVGEEANNVRRLVRTELGSRLNFGRIYVPSADPMASRYKHEIQPELTYTVIPWLDHRSHPFFGRVTEAPFSSRDKISDGDLGSDFGLQFDYNDRVYDRNLVTLALVNKLVEKRFLNGIPDYRELVYFRLAQSFDAYQDQRDDPAKQPLSDISARLETRFDHFQTFSQVNYFPYQKVSNITSRVRLIADSGQFFQVGLTKQYTSIIPGQDVDTRNRTEDYAISSGVITRYLNLMGQFVYDANAENSTNRTRAIKAWAYIAQYKPPGDCGAFTFIQYETTTGERNFKFNFEFNFDGVPKPALPPEELDKFRF